MVKVHKNDTSKWIQSTCIFFKFTNQNPTSISRLVHDCHMRHRFNVLKRYTLIWSTTVISNLYVQYSTVWATGSMLRGFSLFHTRPDWPLVPLIFCNEYWGSFPRVKRPSCDVNLYTSSVLPSHVTGWVPHTRRINTRHKSLILLDRKLRY